MKITNLETFAVPPRWLFVRIDTDEGVVGWGEPVLEGSAEVVRSAVAQFAEYLVGADPLRIEDHWQTLTRGTFYRGGPVFASAVAGIDQALWDICGKVHGVPVHELLGGAVRDVVRAYSWVGGDEPAEIEDAVRAQREAGFTAVKMNASVALGPIATVREIAGVLERAEIARQVLGPDGDFALDFHGRVSLPDARRLLPELAPLQPLFVEEPLVPEQSFLLRRLTDCSSVPIATGERLYSRWDFRPAFEAGIAVAQPDLAHAGGISEVRRIAAMAEMWGVTLAPHCPLGPMALAASLQVAFCTPNFLIQEQSVGMHYNNDVQLLDYVVDPAPFRVEGGLLARPVGAGLGVEVDEAAVRRADQIGHRWRTPQWRHSDGSFAEW